MKRSIVFGLVLFLMSPLFAQDEGPGPVISYSDVIKNSHVTVALSANARNKLSSLISPGQGRVQQALTAGRQFMTLYLEDVACLWDYPDFDQEMGKYVEDPERIKDICMGMGAPQSSEAGGKYSVSRELCPQVSLEDFELGNGGISLTYQVIEVGQTKSFATGSVTFSPEEAGRPLKIVVYVNASNKIYKFAPDQMEEEGMYERTLAALPSESHQVAEQIKRQANKTCRG